jgi:hypothetical protein
MVSQILPVANSRHQLDSSHLGEAEDRRALRVGIRMESVWLDVALILQQSVQDVDSLPHSHGIKWEKSAI